jgi:type I restriction enzyme R subunit
MPRWQAKAEAVRAAVRSEDGGSRSSQPMRLIRAVLMEQGRKARSDRRQVDRRDHRRNHHQRGAERSRRFCKKWNFDIIPHRALMKQGFDTGNGERVDVETAFKNPKHPFRVAIVCAMWLTGFDVECLSTLYIDKPMKAHTLMQAIARANRVYPGKDFGLIVDYNGMLEKPARSACAICSR